MPIYNVKPGDTLSAIAFRHGIKSWRNLYNDPSNASFRVKRPNPNLIFPGDQINIPTVGPAAAQGQFGLLAELDQLDGIPTIEFPPMLVSPPRVGEVNEAAHHLNRQRVIDYINRVLKTYANGHNTVAENLANAQSFVTDERKSNGSDTVLRDAEYYLKARAMIAARKRKSTRVVCKWAGLTLTMIYNGLKFVTTPLGGGIMQADKGNPNAPPGGTEWVARGATDGYKDSVDAMGSARPVSLQE
ncbi:MAG: LysM domain-containing protein [Planctomycetaceae bacterium]